MNIGVPDSGQTRSYSFSSRPGDTHASFLIKHVPGGLMSSWLERAPSRGGVPMTGPLGSFYLREVQRPLLLLAGGTGLAPFLSMLEVLALRGKPADHADLWGDAGSGPGVGRGPGGLRCAVAQPHACHLRGRSADRAPAPGVCRSIWPATFSTMVMSTFTCAGRRRWSMRCASKRQGVSLTSFHYEKIHRQCHGQLRCRLETSMNLRFDTKVPGANCSPPW